MTTITTVAELDALPLDTIVLDCDGDANRYVGGGLWEFTGGGEPMTADEVLESAPLRVIHMPNAGARAMTKCCVTRCVNAELLPIGSTLVCPDHGDGGCSDTIKTEGTK